MCLDGDKWLSNHQIRKARRRKTRSTLCVCQCVYRQLRIQGGWHTVHQSNIYLLPKCDASCLQLARREQPAVATFSSSENVLPLKWVVWCALDFRLVLGSRVDRIFRTRPLTTRSTTIWLGSSFATSVQIITSDQKLHSLRPRLQNRTCSPV